MAKKAGRAVQEPTGATAVPSKDALQRLSYLYQASVLLNNLGIQGSERLRKRPRDCEEDLGENVANATTPEAEQVRSETHGDETDKIEDDEAETELQAPRSDSGSRRNNSKPHAATEKALRPISRHLVRTMKEVAKKATVRMDPAVKRSVCKQCDVVLVPGFTSSVRIKASGPHAHLLVHTCSNCNSQRRFPAPPHLPEIDHHATAGPAASLPSTQALEPTRITGPANPTKRERKEARQARNPIFFERKGHVVVKGGTVLHREE